MTPEQTFWFGAAFTALGALIGALATLAAARLTWQRQSFNEAAAVFRAAFVEETYRLRKGDVDAFRVLTEEVLARQTRAKITFEPFLSAHERVTFEEAWVKYSTIPNTMAPGSLNNRPAEIREALRQIELLLKSAQPK
ncbi:MAG TPA: hypothetical protein DCY64_23520 [Hydrogenophaga sp.]|uniref:hypothetical protein n=1 Tax=Hydrogenophaga sp. TaxID=1904254 RepID=UPI0008D39977|nr:hypothetical protein [Hydrogenophaga sp.]OGA73609.1 MAG: hypothetical protein A2X73_14580 [Burkholderiales bacterium GWE1_65_30]OGA92103.1 MAG: hypothetical protein A2X72_08830 [Burkholderiales bacterium GWF1_66_17]HAX23236.1 hypothetical protein [Hydrogenophaga sp.]HBU17589.1 hypothetical protein [Hydrogenophaga sp.]